jgi:hypothetical protein
MLCVAIQRIYSMAPFPLPSLAELREKYTYNITPFSASVKPVRSSAAKQEAEIDDGTDMKCFNGIFPSHHTDSGRRLICQNVI